jgi:hypothetical protein
MPPSLVRPSLVVRFRSLKRDGMEGHGVNCQTGRSEVNAGRELALCHDKLMLMVAGGCGWTRVDIGMNTCVDEQRLLRFFAEKGRKTRECEVD